MSNTVTRSGQPPGHPPRWRSAAVAVAATSMLLVGCGSDDSTPATASPDDRRAPPAHSRGAAPRSEAPAASPLEGTWRAGPISLEETEATVRRHGLGRWVEDYRANAPFSR